MASATLELFIKAVGVNRLSRDMDKASKEVDQLADEVKKADKEGKEFAKTLKRFGSIAGGAFLVKQLVDFSAAALESAVSAEEAGAAFDTTFGDAAARASKELENFANKAGLTVAEAKQLNATLGAVAQGIGFTQGESADLAVQLTKIAADVASFSNISAGAEPVLNAFRSALVGEREALKTYGIAITEAEVQTEAFILTGKENADLLTRQEKALATLNLIQQKAAVQIGDLERTSASFANQQRLLNAELRETRQEIGEELIPVAAELLPVFREFALEVGPLLIEGFAGLSEAIGNVVLGTKQFYRLGFIDRLKAQGKSLGELADDYREYLKIVDRTNDRLIVQTVQQAYLTREQTKFRNTFSSLIPSQKKYNELLKKETLPFLTQLTKLLGVTNTETERLEDLQKTREDAQSELNKALEEEGLISAQEALRKKELQQQIRELTFFQSQGKDVTAELAVAQEELRLIELALTRESDQLIQARKNVQEAEKDLEREFNNTSNSINKQFEDLQLLQDFMNFFSTEDFRSELQEAAETLNISFDDAFNNVYAAYLNLLEKVKGKPLSEIIAESLEGAIMPDFSKMTKEDEKELSDIFKESFKKGDKELPFTVSGGGGGGGKFFQSAQPFRVDTGGGFSFESDVEQAIGKQFGVTPVKVELELKDDAADLFQAVNTRIQQQGKTFII